MSNFIPDSTTDTQYTYYNDDDVPQVVSLRQMVIAQPDWACSRIREGEKAAAKIASLEAELAKRDEPCVWVDMWSHPNGTKWVSYVSGCAHGKHKTRGKYCPDCGHPIQIEDKSA